MPPAVFVVGHGTKSEAGQAELAKTVASLREVLTDRKVGYGYLELAHPTIEEGLSNLIDEHVSSVTMVPLVLLGAGHAKSDIAGAVEMARIAYPKVQFFYGGDLGVTPELLEAFYLQGASQSPAMMSASVASPTGILLVGRGASDPDANSDLYKIGRLLQEFYAISLLECSFISIARPSVPEGLDRLYRLGARHIVVMPYFLFPGALPDRIWSQAREWSASHQDTGMDLLGPLGAHAVLVQLMRRQIREAEAGEVHMSCDLCIYRQRVPGYESYAGRPITVAFPADHHH